MKKFYVFAILFKLLYFLFFIPFNISYSEFYPDDFYLNYLTNLEISIIYLVILALDSVILCVFFYLKKLKGIIIFNLFLTLTFFLMEIEYITNDYTVSHGLLLHFIFLSLTIVYPLIIIFNSKGKIQALFYFGIFLFFINVSIYFLSRFEFFKLNLVIVLLRLLVDSIIYIFLFTKEIFNNNSKNIIEIKD